MKIAVAGGTGTVGAHVVRLAEEQGHEVVVLSRSNGIDLLDAADDASAGRTLATRLAGVDAVIDVTSTTTQSGAASRSFFGSVTRALLEAERTAAVGHHVALSIVGVDRAPVGYYAGKALQEQLVEQGIVPFTLLRATQFHEFARQMHERLSIGPVVLAPVMQSRPVAASEVAERLVALATSRPRGRVNDLGGPEVESMSRLVRAYARRIGDRRPVLAVPLPGAFGRAMRDGSVLPGPDAQLGTQSYVDWLAALDSPDRKH